MASGDTKTQQLLDILENGGSTEGISGCCNTKTQDYIIQNIEAVKAAESAITAKGGTVGDTGLAGLATEIASIPSGGLTQSLYGRLYCKAFVTDWHVNSADNCSAYVFNLEMLRQQFSVYGFPQSESLFFEYDGQSGTWVTNDWSSGGPISFTTSQLEEDLGIMVTGPEDPNESASFNMFYGIEGYGTDAAEFALDFPNQECFERAFSNTFNDDKVLFDNISIDCYLITGFEIGSEITSIPDNFLWGCNVTKLEGDLSNITSIGDNFMKYCGYFNQPITLSNITSIGTGFMEDCDNYTSTITLNNCVAPTDNWSLAAGSSIAPAYTTGITLAGSSASAWKTALPDSDSSPYRKLIVAS